MQVFYFKLCKFFFTVSRKTSRTLFESKFCSMPIFISCRIVSVNWNSMRIAIASFPVITNPFCKRIIHEFTYTNETCIRKYFIQCMFAPHCREFVLALTNFDWMPAKPRLLPRNARRSMAAVVSKRRFSLSC